MNNPRPRCRCGVYMDCHRKADHKPRRAPRLWLWYLDHSVYQHIAAPIWTRIPEKARWRIVAWLNHSRRRCWADLVSDALTHREKDDCDTHVPSLRPTSTHCASVCDWGGHSGVHDCSCYCGKFQFLAAEGSEDRRATREGRPK